MARNNRLLLERYIKEQYPDAVFDWFIDTAGGTELQFWPSKDSDELFSCVIAKGVLNNKMPTILKEL